MSVNRCRLPCSAKHLHKSFSFCFFLWQLKRCWQPAQNRCTRNRCSKHRLSCLNFKCLFQESQDTSKQMNAVSCPQRMRFPGNLFWDSFTNHNTGNYLWQPMRSFPQHSGEMRTRLTTTIHRRLFTRFFLRDGSRTSVRRLANSLPTQIPFSCKAANAIFIGNLWQSHQNA